MTSIEQIIRQEVNPFDSTTFRPGNFWQEQQDTALTVESIHQEIVTEIEELLDKVAKDHRTRTILLAGDSGSGKSYLLARLKKLFNPKAFFAYIGPWPDSDFIWRHALRNTVDSLMYVPEGQKESQLLLWLKSLSAFRDNSLMKQLLGERQFFVHNLKSIYPTGIYNANEFFGILYDLTNPELYPLACEWLKGDDLDEETLKLLKVKRAIETEEIALKVMGNFGKISAATQPIVLCFDNLDNIDRALDGFINLQALFNVNSIIHNQKLKNFLVVISIVTNTWKLNSKRIQQADRARIDLDIRLQAIDLQQAEALWATRLYPIHRQAEYQPQSPIYPLTRQDLEEKFPGGKTRPRYVLMLGRQLFQESKSEENFKQSYPPDAIAASSRVEKPLKENQLTSRPQSSIVPTPLDPLAAFQLLWLKEFTKTQQKITRIRQFSAPELIQMLREALEALQVGGIQPKLLSSTTYASYSLSYHLPIQLGRIGVVWTEEPNLVSFFHMMKACEKVVKVQLCKTLYLIRAERLGTKKNQGNKLYGQIFTGFPHRHILSDIMSVYYLATYHSLVNAARSGELVVGDKTPDLRELQILIRDSKILEDCPLLHTLGVFSGYTRIVGLTHSSTVPGGSITRLTTKKANASEEVNKTLKKVKDFLLALVKTQQIMGRSILSQNALDQFPDIDEQKVSELIEQLRQENKILILDETAPLEAQLVCLVLHK